MAKTHDAIGMMMIAAVGSWRPVGNLLGESVYKLESDLYSHNLRSVSSRIMDTRNISCNFAEEDRRNQSDTDCLDRICKYSFGPDRGCI